nr:hypothetical protein B0A51_01111 [Rachicladosporium sp. CCFEE 5018]
MDGDMDIDMDIDMEDPDLARLRAQAEAINAQHLAVQQVGDTDSMNGVQQAPEEGEVDPDGIVRNKIHLRGLDNLTTARIEAAVREYCDMTLYGKLQWIDDTSANLVFDTDDAAASAMAALAEVEESDALALRAVKAFNELPETQLQMRYATESDVKVKGAKDRSRFYLMNPEYDPENRIRKRRYDDRGRGSGGRGGYNNKRPRMDRGYSDVDERLARRGSGQGTPFNEDLYDDAPSPRPAPLRDSIPRRDSYASSEGHGRTLRQYEPTLDLLAGKSNGRLQRDRSASPARDGDGRFGFSEEQPYRKTARHRSRSPFRRPVSRDQDNRNTLEQRRKELFPSRPSSALTNGTAKPDLFDRTAATNSAKELFPDKAQHKRQDARVVGHNELATAIGKYHLDGVDESPHTYDQAGPDRASGRAEKPKAGRDLFARINGGSGNGDGRLRQGDQVAVEGFSFKGAGAEKADSDFSIRGASAAKGSGLARELFPVKTGVQVNGKPDLFEGRLGGRTNGRRRAEDLF